ncbi:MAG: pentapeptide repeat-containing protein, partial [Bacteroidales bacterium]|nr:pentapeptide repeat-containing protein [Bacteroidales bacterium]
MPDIATLNRPAEIFRVDLNYFSESFHYEITETAYTNPTNSNQAIESQSFNQKPNWDMSQGNWLNVDFSGLKNLHEKFCFSNMQKCLFIGSNLSGLFLESNIIDSCDFTNSDISNCQIQNSNLGNNIFKDCSLKETVLSKSNIGNCDFSNADFTKTIFKAGNFLKNLIANAKWHDASFIEMQIQDTIFEGAIDGCFFENNTFYRVKFRNAKLTNTFFKNNKKLKHVQFIDCKADKITYAFLKSNMANMTGITLLS